MKTRLAWHTVATLALLFIAAPALMAFQPLAEAPSPAAPTVPVVFTSRNRVDTLNGKYVGPPIEVQGREKAVGGNLMVLYPDGKLADLTGGKLFDVSRPMVSFDGTKIVFSAIRTSRDQWHIFEINLDGAGLKQLTKDDRKIPVLEDPSVPKQHRTTFDRYGDFSPGYLPDGRIIFSSSRYPSLSGSCGQRALNLYVMNADGSGMHRITTERSGAIDPYVLASGKVVFSHWVDNMNVAALAGPGLRPLEVERSFGPSFWIFWATNPDGTDAGRFAFNGGKFADKGGVFQPREMPDGRIVYTYRAQGSLLGNTLTTGISLLAPGAGDGNSVDGIGNPSRLEADHAVSPTPLPDGRILFSYTPSATVQTSAQGKTTAQFNYGLYVVNDKLQGPSLVYDDPARDELDAVAVYPRQAKVLQDLPQASVVSDDPTADLGTTATLRNSNIYADLPLEFREILSPLAGTVVALDFYDDSQTFTTSDKFPALRKQPPKFIGSVPVAPDGSFTATVPADKPIFWLLRTSTGSTARWVTSPPETTFTGFVPTHDYFRPGQVANCTGCHRGHMIRPDITFKEAETNLARLAKATASSSADSNYYAAYRVNDSRLSDAQGRYDWAASTSEEAPWVELSWPVPVTVDEVLLYPRAYGGSRVDRGTLYLSDGTTLPVAFRTAGPAPVRIALKGNQIVGLRFQVEEAQGRSPGLAEIVVHGSPQVASPQVAPWAPAGVKATEGSINLSWIRSLDPFVAGYKVYYGTAPGKYTQSLDVGNVNRYLTMGLEDNVTYYFAVKAYDIKGQESLGFSREVKATYHAPHVRSLDVVSGPISGNTAVTLKGAHFVKGSTVLFGGDHATVIWPAPETILVLAPAHKVGMVDVVVISPDGTRAVLPSSFTYAAGP